MQTLKKIPGMALVSETRRGSFCIGAVEQPNPGYNIMEIWKDIKNYEGFYQASNKGQIKSLKRIIIKCNNRKHPFSEKILKQFDRGNGYYFVRLCKNGIIKNKSVHRLVLETFKTNFKNKPQTNHIDGNKKNNNIENLEWATGSENQSHAVRIGLRKIKYGMENLTRKPVLQFSKNMIFIMEFGGISIAYRKTGVNIGNISECCYNRRKTAGGYIWKFN